MGGFLEFRRIQSVRSDIIVGMTERKQKKYLTVRNVISAVTLVLVMVVIFKAQGEIFEAVRMLAEANLGLILLLIPEQLLMYYCAGQMFFSYLSSTKNAKRVSAWDLARVSFELNFVNHAIPSGGVSGLGYITWRLQGYGATAGQVSFMYMLRYFITITTNQLQTLVAIFALIFMGKVNGGAWWVVWLTLGIGAGLAMMAIILLVIASDKKRIQWFSRLAMRVITRVNKIFKTGEGLQQLEQKIIEKYFNDLYEALMTTRKNLWMILRPGLWGVIYSFLEVATFWLVAMSMGHPEVLPQIMVAEAVGSMIGSVLPTPGGTGGYEGAMIMVMSALGVDPLLATAIVVPARVVVLVGTIVSGYGFYQHAIAKVGRESGKEARQKLDQGE